MIEGGGLPKDYLTGEWGGGDIVNCVFVNSLCLDSMMYNFMAFAGRQYNYKLSCFHIDTSYGNQQVKSTRQSA